MLRLYRRGLKRTRATTRIAASVIALTSSGIPTLVHAAESATLTPIKHAIIIIGENRTFDHIFATYAPVNKGEKVLNLLSEGMSRPMARRGRTMAMPCNTRHSTPRSTT